MKFIKQSIYWLLTVVISIFILEIALRLFFFQVDSNEPLAVMRASNLVQNKIINLFPQKSAGIWQDDPRLGYSHIANKVGQHKSADFNVTYTIGPDKGRFMPKATAPVAGKLLFLGGSYTFGHGINDNETYPYLLSTYWRHWSVVNKAVAGWGTAHAYMTLLDEMNSEKPPSVVIYGLIDHHLKRNYIRKHWVDQIAKVLGGHPHFELEQDHLEFKGIVNASSNLVDPPDLESRELALTQKFLIEMKEICQKHHIPFIVVFLDYKRPIHPSVVKTMIDHEIQILDLSSIKIRGFQNDPHPNPDDHRHIADAIAASFIPEILEQKKMESDQ